jgi:hypothetical protein
VINSGAPESSPEATPVLKVVGAVGTLGRKSSRSA